MTREELQFAACLTILRHYGPAGLLEVLRAAERARGNEARVLAGETPGKHSDLGLLGRMGSPDVSHVEVATGRQWEG
jgi:hypothetical protein